MKINAFPLFSWVREEDYWAATIGIWPFYVQFDSNGGRALVACFQPKKAHLIRYL